MSVISPSEAITPVNSRYLPSKITAAFFVPPMGVIDPTVLTAFGEILTFAGAVIGIDYKHRINNDKT